MAKHLSQNGKPLPSPRWSPLRGWNLSDDYSVFAGRWQQFIVDKRGNRVAAFNPRRGHLIRGQFIEAWDAAPRKWEPWRHKGRLKMLSIFENSYLSQNAHCCQKDGPHRVYECISKRAKVEASAKRVWLCEMHARDAGVIW